MRSPNKRRHAADTYTPEIAEAICERIAQGETLRAICREPASPPHNTVLGWIESVPGLADRYARARQRQYEGWAEDILDISDDVSLDPNDRRIRVDTRKWLLSKLLPKQYGDRVEVNATVSRDPGDLTDVELARIAADGITAIDKGKG